MVLGAPVKQTWRSQEGGLIKAVRKAFENTAPVRQLLDEKLSADA